MRQMGRRLIGASLLLPALIACVVAPSRAAVPPPEAHLLFVGDLMVGRYVAAAMANRGYDPAFAAVRPLLGGADLTLGNLESPIMPTGTYTVPLPSREQYVLTGDARAAGALARAGFDLLSVANNHSFDSGLAGLQATRDALQGAAITPVGLEQQAGSQALAVRTVRGLRLAFLAYTAVPPNVGAARVAGKPYISYVNPARAADLAGMVADVRRARQQADVVVVLMHWGVEYAFVPNAAQRSLAAQLAGAGASLVVGAHPHVAQGLDLQPRAGGATLVAYSLGNALFDQSLQAETRQGLALDCVVDARGVVRARLVPLEIRRVAQGYRMQLAGPAAAQATLGWAARSTPPALRQYAPAATGQHTTTLQISYAR